jgi:catalase
MKNKILILLACAGLSFSANAKQVTRVTGSPVGDNLNSETAGPLGATLLQDHQLIEKLSHFDREIIPERVVHSRGTAAKGYFKATADLSDITRAAPFQSKGKKTPVLVRFSSVINSKGSPETLRDPHGFAVKFYTKEGNWDLVGNNFPVFFIRDAKQFPDMVHSLKPDPKTNLQDANRYFDFFSFKPEATQMLTFLYSPLGMPKTYREMDGSGVHAYKFVNEKCEAKYVKFTWKSRQGNKGLSRMEAEKIQGKNFNHLTQDLYENIEKKNFPIWDLYVQTIDLADVDKFDFNPLDTTKIWPEKLVPSRKVGELVLNEVPDNFFQTTEQSAFAPNNMIPGIEPSEDRLLQGRLFSYADTQRYRLGVNHHQLEPNKTLAEVNTPTIQDGAGVSPHKNSSVNYFPSNYVSAETDASYKSCQYDLKGKTQQIPFAKTQNFKQAGELYRSYDEESKKELVEALGEDLANVKSKKIRNTIVSYFYKADAEYGERVGKIAGADMKAAMKMAEGYKD